MDLPALPRAYMDSSIKDPRYRTEQATMSTEMTLIKSDTVSEGGAGVVAGCKAACRGSSKGRQTEVD